MKTINISVMGLLITVLAVGPAASSPRSTADLLPVQHYVVPAVLRRERRLLPGGAYALRWLVPVPLVYPASGTARVGRWLSRQR